jgi:hypothetical protein
LGLPANAGFYEDVMSGKLEQNYPKGYDKNNKDFLQNLRNGKIPRNYPGGKKAVDPNFLQNLRDRGSNHPDRKDTAKTVTNQNKKSNVYNNKTYKKEATGNESLKGPEYISKDKLFIQDINLDHMNKKKKVKTASEIEQEKKDAKMKKEKEEFKKRFMNSKGSE